MFAEAVSFRSAPLTCQIKNAGPFNLSLDLQRRIGKLGGHGGQNNRTANTNQQTNPSWDQDRSN